MATDKAIKIRDQLNGIIEELMLDKDDQEANILACCVALSVEEIEKWAYNGEFTPSVAPIVNNKILKIPCKPGEEDDEQWMGPPWARVKKTALSGMDALNRLKPGFEAPVCIVASIGHDVSMPSRNRTVLAGLIRDTSNPLATRFELRAPNPHTNTYLALSAIYQAMLDGISYAAKSGKSATELQNDFCKAPGTASPYLETVRAYRSEEDVFEHYTEEERNRLFGVPPATVWEALENLSKYPEKTAVLLEDDVFTPVIIEAYRKASLTRWVMELSNRIIPENAKFVRACVKLHEEGSELDSSRWVRIHAIRRQLMLDELDKKSIFTSTREAVERGDYQAVSQLQLVMNQMMTELKTLYQKYRRNILPEI